MNNNKKIFFYIILHWFLRVYITILHDLFVLYIADRPGKSSDPAARRARTVYLSRRGKDPRAPERLSASAFRYVSGPGLWRVPYETCMVAPHRQKPAAFRSSRFAGLRESGKIQKG